MSPQWLAGERAYWAGEERSANPYRFPSDERLQWLLGFNHARQTDLGSGD